MTVSNLRLDYALRPDGLDKCSLYDFRMCWEKCKLSRKPGRQSASPDWSTDTLDKEIDEAIEPDPQEGDSAARASSHSPVFPFRDPHTQRGQFGVRFLHDHDSGIVVVKGPWIRSRIKYGSKFARQILCMFKPFRDVSELRRDDQTWLEALEEFYISNLETIDERRSAWEADIASKHPEETVKRKERKPADDDCVDVPEEQDESDIDSDGDEQDADETDANCLRFDPDQHLRGRSARKGAGLHHRRCRARSFQS